MAVILKLRGFIKVLPWDLFIQSIVLVETEYVLICYLTQTWKVSNNQYISTQRANLYSAELDGKNYSAELDGKNAGNNTTKSVRLRSNTVDY